MKKLIAFASLLTVSAGLMAAPMHRHEPREPHRPVHAHEHKAPKHEMRRDFRHDRREARRDFRQERRLKRHKAAQARKFHKRHAPAHLHRHR
ncbi:hypothetical protein [Neisseria chenwenguii]|uniref:Uncharacterized protein n=1 Tax=Neisseria chenwenguii TaxID=1853278 RepID=A0A220RYY7_9NEIS|nr:hypothetical protein [Neisseria chenwenguii]ASK26404.1 hypothetical protein BG910_00380 [Neisseria chenwenguii]ROV55827.1 hypothetical protein EGS38_07880 [Neisseria chenwenguii]